MTQAAFLRAVGDGQSVQSKSFVDFMKGKAEFGSGPDEWRLTGQPGAGNKFYALAYHWFEKLRIAEGRAKTARRLENEEALTRPIEHDALHKRLANGYEGVGCRLKSSDSGRQPMVFTSTNRLPVHLAW
jgi:hypothetical protein